MADPLVDLITLQEAQDYLAGGGQPAPANLDAIITGVSAVMQSYASRNFISQPYSVTLDGHGGDRLSLPNSPITAVASLSIDGVAITAAATPTQAGFVFSDTQVLLRGYRFCRGVQNVAIAYTAGFVAIPADLKQACKEGVGAIVAAFQYDDPRAIEVKAGGSSIKLGSLADMEKLCLTSNVTTVLNQRARVAPC